MDRGTYLDYQGRPAVRFQRTYQHSIERVWAAITDAAELSHWFPSKVRMQPQPGGTIEFSDDPNVESSKGTILDYAPPRRLAYTWGSDELHFELESIDDNSCQLTLINVLEARDTAARNAAGWSICLAELDKHIAGEVTNGPHSDTAESWQQHYDVYVAEGMPFGARIPGPDQSNTD